MRTLCFFLIVAYFGFSIEIHAAQVEEQWVELPSDQVDDIIRGLLDANLQWKNDSDFFAACEWRNGMSLSHPAALRGVFDYSPEIDGWPIASGSTCINGAEDCIAWRLLARSGMNHGENESLQYYSVTWTMDNRFALVFHPGEQLNATNKLGKTLGIQILSSDLRKRLIDSTWVEYPSPFTLLNEHIRETICPKSVAGDDLSVTRRAFTDAAGVKLEVEWTRSSSNSTQKTEAEFTMLGRFPLLKRWHYVTMQDGNLLQEASQIAEDFREFENGFYLPSIVRTAVGPVGVMNDPRVGFIGREWRLTGDVRPSRLEDFELHVPQDTEVRPLGLKSKYSKLQNGELVFSLALLPDGLTYEQLSTAIVDASQANNKTPIASADSALAVSLPWRLLIGAAVILSVLAALKYIWRRPLA